MATQSEKQSFSFRGMLGLLVLVAVAYVLVQNRNLLALYTLATVLLSALLIVVAFDIGLKKVTGLTPEQAGQPGSDESLSRAADAKPNPKKRRR